MRMIYEANASSSACRLWRVHMVETSTPPAIGMVIIRNFLRLVKCRNHPVFARSNTSRHAFASRRNCSRSVALNPCGSNRCR